MAVAYLLSCKHDVSLFEKDARLGGHTHTHQIETSRGILPIDTGFIVHNDRTYPNLVRLFQRFGLRRKKSDMSFGVSCQRTGFEYSSRGLGGFFAHRRNLVRPSHYRLFNEILRFNRESRNLLAHPENATLTLGEYVRANDFSDDFRRLYLNPMAASVWSTSLDEIGDFPAFTLIRFFENHGFLGLTTQHQWYVLEGGSSSYIGPLTKPYRDKIHLGVHIESVRRRQDKVHLHFRGGNAREFDEVVFACHAPQALALLADPTSKERQIMESFRTSRNDTVLHKDGKLLPQRPSARASWNYHLSGPSSSATLTYHMNRLQGLDVREDYCVTLNPGESIARDKVLREMTYFHPLYTLDAMRAQSRWSEISGQNRTHFCGAYWFYGFHEDGLNSAIRVAQSLGVSWEEA
jgi:predicted NAD/FAD-binding protein